MVGVSMKFIFVMTLTFIAVMSSARAEACFDSAAEVWKAHPGSHATWRLHDHRRCWMPGWSHGHVYQSVRLAHAYGWASDLVPLPRPRLDFEILDPSRYQRIDPTDGRALADELLK